MGDLRLELGVLNVDPWSPGDAKGDFFSSVSTSALRLEHGVLQVLLLGDILAGANAARSWPIGATRPAYHLPSHGALSPYLPAGRCARYQSTISRPVVAHTPR